MAKKQAAAGKGKKSTGGGRKRPVTATGLRLAHRLEALLRMVRRIAAHEDELCTLLHAAQSADGNDAELSLEVSEVLTAMPTQEYMDDVQAVARLLPAGAPEQRTRKTLPRRKAAVKGVSAGAGAAKRGRPARA